MIEGAGKEEGRDNYVQGPPKLVPFDVMPLLPTGPDPAGESVTWIVIGGRGGMIGG